MAEINEKVEKILINTDNNSLIFEPSEAPAPVSGEKTVRFFDYDGTLAASYTADEFASLAAMPENPTHELLTAQGWNYSLADAKAYVAKYGALDIGQMYRTTDGATKIFCTFGEGRLDPYLNIAYTTKGSYTIDWGDGTQPELVTPQQWESITSRTHSYSEPGDYIISIMPSDGTVLNLGNPYSYSYCTLLSVSGFNEHKSKVYRDCIRSVYIGKSANLAPGPVFKDCGGLETVTIPNDNGYTNVTTDIFMNCGRLKCVVVPNSITAITGNMFDNCYAIEHVILPSSFAGGALGGCSHCHNLSNITIPEGVTQLDGSAFTHCYSLRSIIIPDSLTGLSGSFQYCYSLRDLHLPDNTSFSNFPTFQNCYSLGSFKFPAGMTNIGSSAFASCSSLTSIEFPDECYLTAIGNYAFRDCMSLQTIKIPQMDEGKINDQAFKGCISLKTVEILEGTTTIGSNVFEGCASLHTVSFPSSLKSIGTSVFRGAKSLQAITIPASVKSIGYDAFRDCYGLGMIKFESTTPPTMGTSSSNWSNVPTDCKIYVPTGALEAYTTAANYPPSATYTYVEYDPAA